MTSPIRYAIAAAFASLSLFTASAFGAQNRIQSIDSSSHTAIAGSVNPRAAATDDAGSESEATRLTGITMYFKLTATQQADLNALVQAQQTPGSTWYHRWLTPAEFAARFGLSDDDIAKVKSWLETQGFSVDRVANSRTSITFSGTVGQAQSAFQTSIHLYRANNETHFANASEVQVPSALAGVVRSVRNLDSFRPRSYVRFRQPQTTVKPAFTSSQSGSHYLTPKDVATIYDINAAYNAGYDGTGQSIAVVGQSAVDLTDIEDFQSAAGLTVKDPTVVLVPSTGTSTIYTGDEAESDLDLEYTGGIAKGATIYFVYVGSSSSASVWDSIQYAVDTDLAPIISVSYGACETEFSSSDYSTLNAIMEQGASQGQSIIAASGDSGSTACYGTSGLTTAQQEALSVNYPASSQYVTGLGGTEFPSADVEASNTTYWESASGSDVISSALSYIPEQVWNDDSSSDGLSSGGGGVSTFTARPSWQSGVTGISSGSYRLVPDISLDSSPNNAGYLYCSSDETSTGITGSCSEGFRDSSDTYLTVAGGTSFAAPIFSGMLAILNQKQNSTGQGVINSTLYSLASSSTTYASAFHDITSGSNACSAGTAYCSSAGESGYSATTGYDEATGLGSIDLYNLITDWPSSTSTSLTSSTTTLNAATTTPAASASDVITITIASGSSSITTTPTGTLSIVVDGTTVSSSLALSSGAATYTFSSSTTGSHVIQATYSGDSVYASSTGSVTLTVGGSSTSSTGTFTLAATDVTVASGSSGTSTITVTSKNGYAGTVDFTLSTDSASIESYGCYDVTDATVTANSTATGSIKIYTSESACSSLTLKKGSTARYFKGHTSAQSSPQSPFQRATVPLAAATFAGVLLFGLRRRRARLWATLSCLMLLAILGLTTGCGNSSSSNVAKGTYTLTVDGADSGDSSIAASTTFTLTVD